MYYRIINGKLMEYGDNALHFDNNKNVQELPNLTMQEYQQKIDAYAIQDGKLIDISSTEDYKKKFAETQKSIKIDVIKHQLKELDLKRIRASIEPSIKDEKSGQTYLEYYNDQIKRLRSEMTKV